MQDNTNTDKQKNKYPRQVYSKFNNKEIQDQLKNNESIDENILQTPFRILAELDTDKTINNTITNIRRDKKEWDTELTNLINHLKSVLKQDISNISIDELKELIINNNKSFLNNYIANIKNNAIDLMDDTELKAYADNLTNAIVDLQQQDISNIGYNKFLNTDLQQLIKEDKLTAYIDLNLLIDIQHQYKLKQVQDNIKISDEDIINSLFNIQQQESIKNVERIRDADKPYYENRHRQLENIKSLYHKISDKYEKQRNLLSDSNNIELFNNGIDILSEMQNQNKKLEKTNYNTTLLSNKVFTNKDYEVDKPYLVPIENKKTKELTNTYITLYKEGANSITLSKNHKSINDAVGTLIDAGYKYITTKQLYNFINKGIVSNDYVPQENLDALLKDMLTMDTKAEIDATEQFNLKGYTKYLEEYEQRTGKKAKPVLMQSLLNFKILKNIPLPNGETTDIIQFMDYPAVYEYAKQFKQIAIVPAEIKNIGYNPKHSNKAVQITGLTSVIRDELIRQIEIRKSGINLDIVINTFLANECLFYDVVDKDNTNKVINADKRKDRCKKIELILDTFIDKDYYIKGYKINPKGNVKKYSISITL